MAARSVPQAQCSIALAMTEPELRAKVRNLMTSGTLPSGLPPAGLSIGTVTGADCLVCGATESPITCRYPDGRRVQLHAYCDVQWREERRR